MIKTTNFFIQNGGFMQRWFRLGAVAALLFLTTMVGKAQPPRIQVSGRVGPNDVMIFQQRNVYQINGTLTIAGTLIIEPGTEVVFLDNGRIIDSVGGRIIADGRLAASYNNTQPSSIGLLRYNDMRYFLNGSVVSEANFNEPTVQGNLSYPANFTNPAGYGKYNHIFNVVLDTVNKRLENLTNPGALPGQGSGKVVISPMRAIMFASARLNSEDDIIKFQPWRRLGGQNVNIPASSQSRRILFRAQRVNDYSREWGHIIVLPGARAAFFRDCDFRDFRKDTTVDDKPMYFVNRADTVGKTQAQKTALFAAYNSLNKHMLTQTNGSGGAITTFASRSWMVNCTFTNNLARYRGGAVQMLQAPEGAGVYPDTTGLQIGFYPWLDKNPALTEPNGSPILQRVMQLDQLDRTAAEPAVSLNNAARQLADDARLAVFAGRIRQLNFQNNQVLNSDVDTVRINGNRVLADVDKASKLYDENWKNTAFGGALYISGREIDENRKIEIGLGVNDSIRIADGPNGFVSMQSKDFIIFENNQALTRQPLLAVINSKIRNNRGSKGGALYIGDYTSVIFSGTVRNNRTSTPYLNNDNSEFLSLGGGIYHDNTLGRLQVRGHINSLTEFSGNTAAAGGAIHVNGNTDPRPSPIIGGSDVANPRLRDYGRRIVFQNNSASAHGGAVYTNRNMMVHGAGGFINDLPLAQAYGPGFSVRFENNQANFSGGALAIHLPSIEPPVPVSQRAIRLVRAEFINNKVGNVPESLGFEGRKKVRGGGAVYSMNGDLNLVKGVLFDMNTAQNGNGGAIAMIHPRTSSKRFFISDADMPEVMSDGVVNSYISTDSLFDNRKIAAVPADVRMLTRFFNNTAETNPDSRLMGSGTTQMAPNNIDVKRFHPGFRRDMAGNGIRENGVGLGGAVYVLDSITPLNNFRMDTVFFNRVRIQNNNAYTGAAIYSDNFNLRLALTRTLVTGNRATSSVGRSQDVVTGPKIGNDNPASSDLVGTVFYGDVIGPIPWTNYHIGANSIFDNDARFLIRLPDAPNTKGTLSGGYGTGYGGVDTIRGNYWGRTEANVNTIIQTTIPGVGTVQETFFIMGNGQTHMKFIRNSAQRTDDTQQGPFEQNFNGTYPYTPIAIGKIPDTLLMAGRIYDIFDKGTDIKTADYSHRRMAPVEDFAVGIPPRLRYFSDRTMPSYRKYVRRTTRNLFDADSLNYSTNTENNLWRQIGRLQTEWKMDHRTNEYTHPVGYPLFLESMAAYEGENSFTNNDDPFALNESVFFVINDSTGDYIRVNMRQFTDQPIQNNFGQYPREMFRGRVDFVLDDPSRNGVTARQRRTYEGLMNFGGTESLIPRLADTALNEDISAMPGRRWELTMNSAMSKRGLVYANGARVSYSNRPGMPNTLAQGTDTVVSYYAGERWGSLPVRPGDYVRVISRTVLWRLGLDTAIQKGMGFRIAASTPPPVFTGNKVSLQNPNVSASMKSAFANKIWLFEDEKYNRDTNDVRRPGRDSIFVITAIDSNRFYDPRWAMDADETRDPNNDEIYKKYNQLWYDWYPMYETPNGDLVPDTDSAMKMTALRRWIQADTVWPRDYLAPDYDTTYNQAIGFIRLKGTPSNPYVVPGGEMMHVAATNYPPNIASVDALKNIKLRTYLGANNDEAFIVDTLSKFVYLYPSYFHAQKYDAALAATNNNARFLQQDTLNFGTNNSANYQFRILVTDSLPVFNDITRTSAECTEAGASQDLLVANVTDKLRFYVDYNSDDETEDSVARNTEAWDFRYGKTSYGFLAKSLRENPNDTSFDEVNQIRPIWLSDRYMMEEKTGRLGGSDTNAIDEFANAFTTRGVINIAIPRQEALNLLKPKDPADAAFDALNLDTLMTVVVNDGHSGVNYLSKRIFVNVSPTITTQSLAKAKEDQDYNIRLLDFDKRIVVSDPNRGQRHTYRLLYPGDPEDSIAKDPCFAEAGTFDVRNLKKTPRWLKINPVSGLLYGTPGVKDAPRKPEYNNLDTVTVLVTDEGGLTDVKWFLLEVDSTNHNPKVTTLPSIRCLANGEGYVDTLLAIDRDLLRDQPVQGRERLTLEVVSPTGVFELDPSTINGLTTDTVKFQIRAIGGVLDIKPTDIVNGKVRIRIRITDGEAEDFVEYLLNVSDPTDFTARVRVQNNDQLGAYQDLYFGTATNATTGEKADQTNRLDNQYCEYELPPLPPTDVFDARWTVSETNGILRNIFPKAATGVNSAEVYKGRFQPGNLQQASAAYPVTISWKTNEIPARTDQVKNPSGGSWFIRDPSNGPYFSYNMNTGVGNKMPGNIIQYTLNGNDASIIITADVINGFIIYYDFVSEVNETETGATAFEVNAITPNPVDNQTSIAYTLPTVGQTKVEVFDALGKVVATLFDGMGSQGPNTLQWNVQNENIANGVYTLKLTHNGVMITKNIAVVR